jgi:hypothetical protein
MAGAVTAVDGVMAHCASCQEQESRIGTFWCKNRDQLLKLVAPFLVIKFKMK